MMVCVSKVHSQVSIGVPVPSGSAMLDVSSTTKGFLPPRMSEIQRMLILKPEAGLIVYQTDHKKGLYFYDGNSWTYVLNQLNTLNPNETIGGGVSDHISTLGTVVAGPTFITTDYLNVGGYAAYLKTSRNIFGKPFNGTADLTSGLVSDGITSSSTLAVGTNATITGTLTLPSLSTSSLLVTNGSKTVVSGSLTGDITTTGLVATLSNTGVISGTYGSSTAVPQITVDSKGRITTITVTNTQIPDASATTSGLVNTITQTFAGNKTISGTLGLTGLATMNGGLTNNGRLTNIGNATITGTLLVSTVSPTSSAAVLELSSTTQGFLPPRLTTSQRDLITAPVAGLTIWNSTNLQLEFFNGSVWVNMDGKTDQNLVVGHYYQGGKVAYIFTSSDIGYVDGQTHGLIAAISDQSTSTGIRWNKGSNITTSASILGIGGGLANTTTIITSQGQSATTYAAGLARAYTGGGYSDWYLPTRDELNKLYINQDYIGGFSSGTYWSSSEKSASPAYKQTFGGSDYNTSSDKSSLYRVRAVRTF